MPGDTKDKLMGLFSLADAMSKSCWLNLQESSQRLYPDEAELRLTPQEMTTLFSECCEFDNFRTVSLARAARDVPLLLLRVICAPGINLHTAKGGMALLDRWQKECSLHPH